MPTERFLDRFYSSGMYRGLQRGVTTATSKHLIESKTLEKARLNAEFAFSLYSDQNHLGSISVLDFGSGTNSFLIELKHQYPLVRIYGVEPAVNFSYLQKEQLDGLYENIEALSPTVSFDVITLWHVLEHLANPVEVLSNLREHLTPDGMVCVQVPNANLYTNIQIIHIEHLYHFTPKTLVKTAELAGLSLVFLTNDHCLAGSLAMKAVFTASQTPVIHHPIARKAGI